MQVEFKNIEEKDIGILSKYVAKQKSRSCDYTLGILYMWNKMFNYQYCIYKDCLVIKAKIDNKELYYYPIGDNAIEVIKDLKITEFFSITEDSIRQLQDYFEINMRLTRDYSDYLYEAKSLATLEGHKNNKHRNHVNKFLSLYPNYEFVEYKKEDYNQVEAFLNKYHKDGTASESSKYEIESDKEIIKLSLDINQIMFMLKVNNEVIGLTMGEVIDDTLYVQIEKCLTEYEGSFPMINKLFASYILDHYPIKYINREDDAGDIGLRTSKTNYHPLMMINKYDVSIIKEK